MKAKKIISWGLIGGLSIGSVIGVKAFADMPSNTIEKNTVMTRNVAVQSDDKETRELALNYIERYLNEKVDVNSLYEKSEIINVDGKEIDAISWSTTNDNNAENIRYTATLDIKTNELRSLQYMPEDSKNENYKNFSYKEGKDLATKFIEENNLLDNKDFKLASEERSAEEENEFPAKYNTFIFEYDGGKKCVIQVSNDLKKVTQIIFYDESQGLG
jgi:hypothetical protein